MQKIYRLLLSLLAIAITGNCFSQVAPQFNRPTSATAVASPQTVPVQYDDIAWPPTVNYVRIRTALGPVSSAPTFHSAGYAVVQEATTYSDGLGRTIQVVNRQMSPTGKDFVTPTVIDQYGREPSTYLPYQSSTGDGAFKSDVANEQFQAFYNKPGLENEFYFVGKTIYEPSPLNRVIKKNAAGTSWAADDQIYSDNFYNVPGKGIEMIYRLNHEDDSIRRWAIGYDSLRYNAADSTRNIPYTIGMYTNAELRIITTRDEDGNMISEYKDSDGKIILKKVILTDSLTGKDISKSLLTYYIYDDFDRLRFVITPKATAWLNKHSWSFSSPGAGGLSTVVRHLCYRYEYDERGNVIASQQPGKEWELFVHDYNDRLVFRQDAIMKKTNKWLTVLFDDVDRPTTTGFIPFTYGRDSLQIYVAGKTRTTSRSVFHPIIGTNPTNLVLGPKVITGGIFTGQKSVTLTPGVSLVPGSHEIVVKTLVKPPPPIVVASNPLPVPDDSLLVLTITNYGDFTGADSLMYSDIFNGRLDTSNNNNAEPVLTAAEQSKSFNQGLVTYTQARIIDNPDSLKNGDFLNTGLFYDTKGRVIQKQSNNYTTGNDTTTNRYNFSGVVITSIVTHQNSTASNMSITTVKTNYDYDHAGRITKVYKSVNGLPRQLIVNREYDDWGRIIKKELNKVGSTPLETLDYTYNIRGWLAGINRDYVQNTGSNFRWFSEAMRFDWGCYSNFYNGSVSAVLWRSRGDGERRSFAFTYDHANRMLGSDYTEFNGNQYADISTSNFDVTIGNGVTPAYDENGNILAVSTWGKVLNNSQLIDQLTYNYKTGSNQLLNVSDAVNNSDSKLGDFKTSTLHPHPNKTEFTVDYAYDDNGNLIKDLNKDLGTDSLAGLTYNHMNVVSSATFYKTGGKKGDIHYIWDANGNKLAKVVNEIGQAATKTLYLEGTVYENNQLQFLSHEEGRFRYVKHYYLKGDSAYGFVTDYFIKDRQGNTRLVLNPYSDTVRYFATLETPYRAKENALFTHIDQTAYPDSLVPGGYPIDTSLTNPNKYVSRLNGSGNKVGPMLVLHVMSGDTITMACKAFYRPNGSAGSPTSPVPDLLTSIATGIVGASGDIHGTVAELSNTSTSPMLGALNSFLHGRDTSSTTKPRAYLNWMLVGEDFKLVGSYPQSSALQVGNADVLNTLAQSNVPITRNGYIIVYPSNETQNWDVFFDNLVVEHKTGPLLEETHYYPSGMEMKALCSKASGKLSNKYKFGGKEKQDEEFSDGKGLSCYDFSARMYDPQLMRFMSLDPHGESYPWSSPYAYGFNNFAQVTDPTGKDGVVTGSGTEEDPYEITANYYSYGMTDEQNAGLQAAIKQINNGGNAYKVETKSGCVYVKFNLSAKECTDQKQAQALSNNDQTNKADGHNVRWGNMVTQAAGTHPVAMAHTDNKSIELFDKNIKNNIKPGIQACQLYEQTFVHEIGHNLGGSHFDPGHIMIDFTADPTNSYDENGDRLYNFTISYADAEGVRAIIGRIDMPTNNVESRYLTDQELTPLRAHKSKEGGHNSSGTSGRLTKVDRQDIAN